GDEIKNALKRTVRSLPVDVRGTREEGFDWTIVDGRRRWKLTAREVDSLEVGRDGLRPVIVDTGVAGLSAIIAGLEQKSVAKGADTVVAQLLAPNQTSPPDLTNYDFTIEPLQAGESWAVKYSFAALLTIDDSTGQHVLSSPGGKAWAKGSYNQKT